MAHRLSLHRMGLRSFGGGSGNALPPWRHTKHRIDGIAPSLYADFRRGVYALNGARKSFSDLFTISSGSKVIVGADGTLQTVAANAPAFDYSAGERALLLEGAATNLLVRSSEIDNAAWSKNGVSVTADQTVAPDGTVSADAITETATTGLHQVGGNATVASGAVYSFSVYAKADTARYVQIGTGGAGRSWVNFDLQTGALGDYSSSGLELVGVPKAYALGGGWYRLHVQIAPGNGTMSVIVSHADSLSAARNPSYTATGKRLYAWGARVVAETYPSSDIATAGSTVTRVTDLCSLTAAANAAVGVSAGSVAWRGVVNAAVASQPLIGLGSGYSLLRGGSTAAQVVADGSSAAALSLGSAIPGTIAAAIGWSGSGRVGALNGAAAVSDATALDRSLAALFLGGSSGPAAGSSLVLMQLVAWPAKGSGSALQSQARVYA